MIGISEFSKLQSEHQELQNTHKKLSADHANLLGDFTSLNEQLMAEKEQVYQLRRTTSGTHCFTLSINSLSHISIELSALKEKFSRAHTQLQKAERTRPLPPPLHLLIHLCSCNQQEQGQTASCCYIGAKLNIEGDG